MLIVSTGRASLSGKSGAMAAKSERFNMRMEANDRLLIESAAAARGMSLSEFVLESARREAEDSLLDQSVTIVNAEYWDWLTELVQREPQVDEKLQRTMQRVRERFGSLPWEQPAEK